MWPKLDVKFKPALAPICVYFFLLYFSSTFVLPFLTLQLRALGLSLEDAALVGGLSPMVACVAAHSGPLGGGLEFSQLVELECLTAC